MIEEERHFKPISNSYSPELYARIKRTSQFYYQGLGEDQKPLIFKIEAIRLDSHPFRMNNNNYQAHDLAFFTRNKNGRLIKLG
jgi:hypothetical protein